MTNSRVAFQGEPRAYSELAAMEYFGEMTNSLPFESFRDVFAAVETGKAEYGILPIENSLTGSIHMNYDLLLENVSEGSGDGQDHHPYKNPIGNGCYAMFIGYLSGK
jgi:prephenate dehydratase